MNVPTGDARKLSMWEYEALLHHWNEAHDTDVKPPDHEMTQKLIERINLDPRLSEKKPRVQA